MALVPEHIRKAQEAQRHKSLPLAMYAAKNAAARRSQDAAANDAALAESGFDEAAIERLLAESAPSAPATVVGSTEASGGWQDGGWGGGQGWNDGGGGGWSDGGWDGKGGKGGWEQGGWGQQHQEPQPDDEAWAMCAMMTMMKGKMMMKGAKGKDKGKGKGKQDKGKYQESWKKLLVAAYEAQYSEAPSGDDLIYTTVQEGDGWMSVLTCDKFSNPAGYMLDELKSSKNIAEETVAKAALEAEFRDAHATALQEREVVSRKRKEMYGPPPPNRLINAMQIVVGRSMLRGDIEYTSEEVGGSTVATVTLNCLEVKQSFTAEPVDGTDERSKTTAECAAAALALKAFEELISLKKPHYEDHRAKKKKAYELREARAKELQGEGMERREALDQANKEAAEADGRVWTRTGRPGDPGHKATQDALASGWVPRSERPVDDETASSIWSGAMQQTE